MTQFKSAKKLDALDRRIEKLEKERHALEQRAFGAGVAHEERRVRYLGLADDECRHKLVDLDRRLYALRREQVDTAITYWTALTDNTRRKLDDLKSDEPDSRWRRDIWWDALTLLWIIAGACWLVWDTPGAVGGALATAAITPMLWRGRKKRRLQAIRNGDNVLRSGLIELHKARTEAAMMPEGPLFPPEEPPPGRHTTAHA